jgi:hypothetical protein
MIVSKPMVLINRSESIHRSVIFLLAVFLFFFLSIPAYSTIRYVKAENATPVYPFTSWETASDSLQKVVNMCESGDTIMIGSGIYRELVRSERTNISLSFIGTDVDSCIFDLSGFSPNAEFVFLYVYHSINVENLNFTTTTQMNDHYGIFVGFSPFPQNINVRNCLFSNLDKCIDAPKASGEISDNYFYKVNNAIKNSDRPSGEFIKIYNNTIIRSGETAIRCSFGLIHNNWVIFDQGVGIQGSGFFRSEQQIYNNFITKIIPPAYYFGLLDAEGKIINNVIIGVGVGIRPIGSEIKNNVIAYCSEAAIRFTSPGHSLNNNINFNSFYQNNLISYDLSLFNPDTTIYYTSDPMFENQDSNNFLLQMFSPLINAGDPNILDVDGSRSDVGLYGGPYGQSYQYKDLPPKKPKVISATKLKNKVNFLWRGGTEADFNSFSLYRDRDPQFIPDDNNKIFTGIDTLFTDSLTDPTGSYSYKLTAKDNQGNVSKLDSVTVVLTGITDEEEIPTPERIYLYQNYPNPFNPSTKIKFSLTEEAEVILRVYNVNGELVAMLQNGWLPAGEYEREFSPATIGTLKDIASGVYFYNLLVRDKNLIPLFVKTEKMMFLK